jgi:hypothetical protein
MLKEEKSWSLNVVNIQKMKATWSCIIFIIQLYCSNVFYALILSSSQMTNFNL